MTPQQPQNPNDLHLQPSRSAGTRPDFSNVEGHSETVPDRAPVDRDRPDFSNVQGHAETVPAGGRTYTVKPGDTLSHIAQHVYGKASRWHAIFEANRDQLDDPDLIRPGQVLTLPSED
jgi:nucleoid-associated protein YgaU